MAPEDLVTGFFAREALVSTVFGAGFAGAPLVMVRAGAFGAAFTADLATGLAGGAFTADLATGLAGGALAADLATGLTAGALAADLAGAVRRAREAEDLVRVFAMGVLRRYRDGRRDHWLLQSEGCQFVTAGAT